MIDSLSVFLLTHSVQVIRFAVIFLTSLVTLFIVKKVVVFQLRRIVSKIQATSAETDRESQVPNSSTEVFLYELVKIWNWVVLVVLSFGIAITNVNLPASLEKPLELVLSVAIGLYLVRSFSAGVGYVFNRYIAKRERYEEGFDPTIVLLLRQVSVFLIWLTALLFLIQNLGYEISALIGGLGLGGLAVAFAVQNLLADVFSSISIYFDKPFKIGDFIVVGADSGVVKKIGIKSTRLQTLQGQELIISNKELTETRVNNFKRMNTRRIEFIIGVEYDTSQAKLKKIPQIVQKVIESQAETEFGRAHFKAFGDFSLQFEIVYTVTTAEYGVYMDVQQAINYAILEEFNKAGIAMAFPTQKVYTVKD